MDRDSLQAAPSPSGLHQVVADGVADEPRGGLDANLRMIFARWASTVFKAIPSVVETSLLL